MVKSKLLVNELLAAAGFDKARAIESASCANAAVGGHNAVIANPYSIFFIIGSPFFLTIIEPRARTAHIGSNRARVECRNNSSQNAATLLDLGPTRARADSGDV